MPLEPTIGTVNVPIEQLREMQANAEQVKQLLSQRELEAASANIRAQTAAGQIDALARSHRSEIEQERQRAGNVAKRSELAQALAGQNLLPAAAGQLSKLWSDQLHAEATTDGFAVRTASYQDVGTFVAEQLAKPEFAHYLRSDHQAAPANNAAPAAAPTPTPPTPEPRTLGEAVVARYRDEEAARIAANQAPGADLSRGFGGFGRGSGSTPSIANLSHILRGGR